ncbi:MAG: hypothetical protein RL375_2208 [Pseudomonadota bacterium]
MDLKVPIAISDELTDEVIAATGLLDLASGEIRRVEYVDYDVEAEGPPWESDDYEFSCGTLTHQGKDVEFRVDVNKVTGQYSVTASELLEIKMRAAALFAGISGKGLLDIAEHKTDASAPAAKTRRGAPARKK